MSDSPTMAVTAGVATRIGGRSANADGAYVHQYDDYTAAVIVDGVGSTPDVVEMVRCVAPAIAWTAARTTPLAGLLAGAAMTRDAENAVAVCAVVDPDTIRIAWIGDARAYVWNGDNLIQQTTDHTVGQLLRAVGAPEVAAKQRDHWIRTSLAIATINTIEEARVDDAQGMLVVLTSDGVHDALNPGRMEAIVRQWAHDPQSLADALVAEAVAVPGDDPADNATVVVLPVGAR